MKSTFPALTRRRFIRASAALGLLAGLQRIMPAYAFENTGLKATPAGDPEPDEIDLLIREQKLEFGQRRGNAITINGTVPGPLVRLRDTSPVSKDVKAMSKDMIVRTVDHPRPEECLCVTEERFAPVGENHELLEGFRQFRNLPPEKQGPLVVAVEDASILLGYSPESAHDPSRPARLLFVALVLALIERTGAECYKVVDDNDPDAPCFAKGVDQAINVLAADEALARRIEQAIERLHSIEGADAIRKKLLDAKTKSLVPQAAVKRFRETLDAEVQRLTALRPTPAA